MCRSQSSPSPPSYSLPHRVVFVCFEVLYGSLLAGVGVAVFAEVGAGVVFADIFAYHAAAELALPLVAVVFVLIA